MISIATAEPVAELLKRMSTTRPPPAGSSDPAEVERDRADDRGHRIPGVHGAAADPVHVRFGLRKVVFDLRRRVGEEYDLRERADGHADRRLAPEDLSRARFRPPATSRPSAESKRTSKPCWSPATIRATNWSFGIDYNDEGVLIATAIIPDATIARACSRS